MKIKRTSAASAAKAAASLAALTSGGWVIHPNINEMGAHRTGRLSAHNPNVQNISNADTAARSYEPVQAREFFGPRPGYIWAKLDFAGQEGRILADLAGIEEIIRCAREGRDINGEIADRCWGGEGNELAPRNAAYSLELAKADLWEELSSLEKQAAALSEAQESRRKAAALSDRYRQLKAISQAWERIGWNPDKARKGLTSDEALSVAEEWLRENGWSIVKAEKTIGKKATRTRAKNLLYAYVYGAGKDKIGLMLGASREEGIAYLGRFNEMFPEVGIFSKSLIRQARIDGYIINPYGRRLDIPVDYAYKAVNYMIQSTAADMMKHSMIRVHPYLKGTGLDAHIILSVHDELDLEIRREHAHDWLIRGVKEIMKTTRDAYRFR